jgi:RNA polymerase sigma-70 factor (sigma-E family)
LYVEGVLVSETGFEEFVRARRSSLVRFGWALTGDRGQGEDLAQAAFDRLWPHWAKVSAGGDPWPYVQRIAINLALSWRRRRWRNEIPVAEPTAPPAADDDTDSWVSRQLVAGWLDGLPPRQRAVVVLRFLMDLSVEETAVCLGCSIGTVKSQTSKGLQALRQKHAHS